MDSRSIWIVMAVGARDLDLAYDTVARILKFPKGLNLKLVLVLDTTVGSAMAKQAEKIFGLSNEYKEALSVFCSGHEYGLLNLLGTLEIGWTWCFERANQGDVFVKLDPDCLVLAPTLFSRALSQLDTHGPGSVGNIRFDPRGVPRSIVKHRIKTLIDRYFPLGVRKLGKTSSGKWRYAFSLKRPAYRVAIGAAWRNGWRLGEDALGAFRMMSWETLVAIRSEASYKSVMSTSFLGLNREEDLFYSMYTKAIGHNLIELEDVRGPSVFPKAWLDAFSLMGLDIEVVRSGKYDAIHPAKIDPTRCPFRSLPFWSDV